MFRLLPAIVITLVIAVATGLPLAEHVGISAFTRPVDSEIFKSVPGWLAMIVCGAVILAMLTPTAIARLFLRPGGELKPSKPADPKNAAPAAKPVRLTAKAVRHIHNGADLVCILNLVALCAGFLGGRIHGPGTFDLGIFLAVYLPGPPLVLLLFRDRVQAALLEDEPTPPR